MYEKSIDANWGGGLQKIFWQSMKLSIYKMYRLRGLNENFMLEEGVYENCPYFAQFWLGTPSPIINVKSLDSLQYILEHEPGLSISHVRRPGLNNLALGLASSTLNKSFGLVCSRCSGALTFPDSQKNIEIPRLSRRKHFSLTFPEAIPTWFFFFFFCFSFEGG